MTDAFQDRVLDDLLPAFCDHPDRSWCRDGFQTNWTGVSELDASDFLRAMDAGLILHLGRGRYRAPRSLASEYFFWEGPKKTVPRRLTLWIEPVITVAVLARMHFDLGWPKNLIGTQSRNWEFDVTAYRSSDLDNEYVACEVKKSISELDQLVGLMQRFAVENTPTSSISHPKEINAYRKLKGLQVRRAHLFWAVGPDATNHVFRVKYNDEGIALEVVGLDALIYPDR